MTRNKSSTAGLGKHAHARGPTRHPHDVATIALSDEIEEFPDQPFAEGREDQLDPDLRHRLISEAAFHRQAERGYDEGYDREDWLDAAAEVDHLVVRPKSG
jgi:hypothetical protein